MKASIFRCYLEENAEHTCQSDLQAMEMHYHAGCQRDLQALLCRVLVADMPSGETVSDRQSVQMKVEKEYGRT